MLVVEIAVDCCLDDVFVPINGLDMLSRRTMYGLCTDIREMRSVNICRERERERELSYQD